MNASKTVYLHVWSGEAELARKIVEKRYPGSEIVTVSHRDMREGGWKRQIRYLRAMHGLALVFFFKRLADVQQLELIRWSGLLHRCHETVVADSDGQFQIWRRKDWVKLFPGMLLALLADAAIFSFSWPLLYLWRVWARPQPLGRACKGGIIAYLFPYPSARSIAGGAISHIRGVLGGLAANSGEFVIFSAVPLSVEKFQTRKIPSKRCFSVFMETVTLSYNLRFATEVFLSLRKSFPRFFYQRHGRFAVAGALLSTWTGVPLVLEYNGSELFMADYCDPARFRSWLRLCEEVSLACAALIVVVSDVLRDELLQRGVPASRILVNPNAVDPTHFHPGCGGSQIRQQFGITSGEIVVAFVGTFSYWHGIPVLQEAIRKILEDPEPVKLRFLLIGDGPLHSEMRENLRRFEDSGDIVFTGIIAHDRVRSYLDAADILVSPHVPMPDGKPFFGSPTKLFEYMAMGKAIAASNLDQLADVLNHNETALLFAPGNAGELVAAIRLLARNPVLRSRLGDRARDAVCSRHTWRQNAARVLNRCAGTKKSNEESHEDLHSAWSAGLKKL